MFILDLQKMLPPLNRATTPNSIDRLYIYILSTYPPSGSFLGFLNFHLWAEWSPPLNVKTWFQNIFKEQPTGLIPPQTVSNSLSQPLVGSSIINSSNSQQPTLRNHFGFYCTIYIDSFQFEVRLDHISVLFTQTLDNNMILSLFWTVFLMFSRVFHVLAQTWFRDSQFSYIKFYQYSQYPSQLPSFHTKNNISLSWRILK